MNSFSRQFVIGTAGHIDHGKTALVKALTGIDTDRLKEEKERGITVDLGFAHFSSNITIIDVPGHERLIKNMVAGVSTIDLVLFVVAADDGIMPQTKEHFDIINLLGLQNGIFVITKIDLVDSDWIILIDEEIRNYLKNSPFQNMPIVQTSATKEIGIQELRSTILNFLKDIPPKKDNGIFRLPIDRVFSKPGFGTIVTGSVLSGSVKINDLTDILPQQLNARIRGLQSHENSVTEVSAGYRAAINLANINQKDLHRGQVITSPGFYEPVERFNAKIELLRSAPLPLKNQMRVRLHLNTCEVLGRVVIPKEKNMQPGESNYVQIRLEEKVFAAFWDRFVIRQYSPQITIGGGIILETNPEKFRKKYYDNFLHSLESLANGTLEQRLLASFSSIELSPLTEKEIRIKIGLNENENLDLISKMVKNKQIFCSLQGKEKKYFSFEQIKIVEKRMRSILNEFHLKYPGRTGKKLIELTGQLSKKLPEDLIQIVLNDAVDEGVFQMTDDTISLKKFQLQLSSQQFNDLSKIEKIYLDAGFSPPAEKEVFFDLKISEKNFRESMAILSEQKKIIYIDVALYFHAKTIESSLAILRQFFQKNQNLRVSEFKELIKSSRKFALPLLNYFDKKGYTQRQGDSRIKGNKL